jgi:hypothetical protein
MKEKKPNGYWTLEKCKEDALRFNARGEWKSQSSGYWGAQRYGWIDECCSHMTSPQKPHGYWTLEKCKEDALNYKTKNEWQKNSSGYGVAFKNNWLLECCDHMELHSKPNGYWTLEKCKEDALRFNARGEWKIQSSSGYGTALKNNWLLECCDHMELLQKPHSYWTLDRCKEDALNYKTKNEWYKSSGSGYRAAIKNNWLDECCSHMTSPQKPHGYWTLEKCKEDALNYKTKNEWQKNSSGYGVAHKKNYISDCCLHMDKAGGPSKPELELLEVIKEKYTNASSKVFKNKNPDFVQSRFEMDIFIPELFKGIEFNGKYWHSVVGLKRSRPHWPEDKIEKYHEIKEKFFKSCGVKVLFINEEDWIRDKREEIDKCFEFLMQK